MGYIVKRHFFLYFILSIVTLVCGLFSRSKTLPLPDFIVTYGGDTLWALMVYWIFCLAFPKTKTVYLFIATVFFSYSIEFSQFYQAPWINSIRNTTLGGLILGFGFLISDLVCLFIGALIGGISDYFLIKYQTRHNKTGK